MQHDAAEQLITRTASEAEHGNMASRAIDTALVLTAQGEGFGIKQLAQFCDISESLIYKKFQSKEGIEGKVENRCIELTYEQAYLYVLDNMTDIVNNQDENPPVLKLVEFFWSKKHTGSLEEAALDVLLYRRPELIAVRPPSLLRNTALLSLIPDHTENNITAPEQVSASSDDSKKEKLIKIFRDLTIISLKNTDRTVDPADVLSEVWNTLRAGWVQIGQDTAGMLGLTGVEAAEAVKVVNDNWRAKYS